MLLLLGYQLVSHVCQATMPTRLALFIAYAVLLVTVVQMPQLRPLHVLQDTTALEATSHVLHALQAEGAQMQLAMNQNFVPQDFFLSLHQQNVLNALQAITVLLATKIPSYVRMVAIAMILVNRNVSHVKQGGIVH